MNLVAVLPSEARLALDWHVDSQLPGAPIAVAFCSDDVAKSLVHSLKEIRMNSPSVLLSYGASFSCYQRY